MKFYETGRLLAEPFLPPLYAQVRAKLHRLIKTVNGKPLLLDVGGRKSPYTIGLGASITVIDLPRESETQEKLHLGINKKIIQETKKFRSNIKEIVLKDMIQSDFTGESFDIAVAVEVLEHVEADEAFVSEVARVLKPGGTFLMTTPNGDWVKNKNPDHKRHYLREQLAALLTKYFDQVEVDYAVVGGYTRKLGLKSWSVRHPFQTVGSMLGNFINSYQSAGEKIKDQPVNTHHLIAVGIKKL
jgi:SAM-dependent methyltransferase